MLWQASPALDVTGVAIYTASIAVVAKQKGPCHRGQPWPRGVSLGDTNMPGVEYRPKAVRL